MSVAAKLRTVRSSLRVGAGSRLLWLSVVLLFMLAVAVRLLDLTEPPLDYQPTRQLHGALIARSIYYQLDPAADPDRVQQAMDAARGEAEYEPPVLESLVALSYLVAGQELLWLARLWNILFWMAAAVLVYGLASRLARPDGALFSLAYMLFLPLAVTVSRSFQPDSLMVALLVAGGYALIRWTSEGSWRWAIAAGVFCGLAVLVKGRPAPIVGGMLVGVVLAQAGLRGAIRSRQVWVVGGLAIGIPAIYYLGLQASGTLGQLGQFSTGVAGLLRQPSFYARWIIFVDELVYSGLAVLGLVAVPLMPRAGRGLALGLWVGYVLYGLLVPYNIYTHDYYNLPLVPIVALTLAPAGSLLLAGLAGVRPAWKVYAAVAGLALLGYRAWLARTGILATDYHSEAFGWIKMGRELPTGGSIIGLTHDYGTRIAYYGWRRVATWPTSQDRALFEIQGRGGYGDFETEFESRTDGYEYFLVTLFGEFEQQADLRSKLNDEYRLAIDGEGYLLFDLTDQP